MAAEFSGADASVERLAEMFRRVFAEAVMEDAGMGRTIYEAVQGVEERPQTSKPTSAPVGCNDPCPCGSGPRCGGGAQAERPPMKPGRFNPSVGRRGVSRGSRFLSVVTRPPPEGGLGKETFSRRRPLMGFPHTLPPFPAISGSGKAFALPLLQPLAFLLFRLPPLTGEDTGGDPVDGLSQGNHDPCCEASSQKRPHDPR
jgi:hypothetical protein